jgi:hypothetical protein
MAEVEKGALDKLVDWLSGWKTSFEKLRTQFGTPVAVVVLFFSVAA